MESAIKTLVTTFLSSSKGKENLDSKSFQKLISSQFGSMMEVSLYIPFVLSKYPSVSESFVFFKNPFLFFQETNDSSAIKEMQRGLDENSDGKVSFQEYLTLIGYLANSLSQRKSGSSADAS